MTSDGEVQSAEEDLRCRFCLESEVDELIPLFCVASTQNMLIAHMALACTGAVISNQDKLPQYSCDQCLAALDVAYSSWKRCRQSWGYYTKDPSLNADAEDYRCRICLRDEVNELISLYCICEGNLLNVSEVLKQFAGLDTGENDNHPQFVCDQCLSQLNAGFEFKKSCIKSVNQLKQGRSGKSSLAKHKTLIKIAEPTNPVNDFSELSEFLIPKTDVDQPAKGSGINDRGEALTQVSNPRSHSKANKTQRRSLKVSPVVSAQPEITIPGEFDPTKKFKISVVNPTSESNVKTDGRLNRTKLAGNTTVSLPKASKTKVSSSAKRSKNTKPPAKPGPARAAAKKPGPAEVSKKQPQQLSFSNPAEFKQLASKILETSPKEDPKRLSNPTKKDSRFTQLVTVKQSCSTSKPSETSKQLAENDSDWLVMIKPNISKRIKRKTKSKVESSSKRGKRLSTANDTFDVLVEFDQPSKDISSEEEFNGYAEESEDRATASKASGSASKCTEKIQDSSNADVESLETIAEADHYMVIYFKGFLCCGCLELFNSQKQFQDHREAYHSNTRFNVHKIVCDICSTNCSMEEMASHRILAVKKIFYYCKICECLLLLEDFKTHRQSEHSTAEVAPIESTDPLPNKFQLFVTKWNISPMVRKIILPLEIQNHVDDKTVFELMEENDQFKQLNFRGGFCCGCQLWFDSPEVEQTHQDDCHSGKKHDPPDSLQCEWCRTNCPNESELARHRLSKTKQLYYFCKVCDDLLIEENFDEHCRVQHLELEESLDDV